MEKAMVVNREIVPDATLTKEIEKVKKIQPLVVTDVDTMKVVADTVIRLKEIRKVIVEKFKSIKEDTDRAHKQACKMEKEFLSPVDERIKEGDSSISKYLLDEKKKRDEENRKAEAERQAKAAEEQKKLDAQLKRAVKSGNTEKAAEVMEKAQEVAAAAAPVVVEPEKINTGTLKTEAGSVNVAEDIEIEIVAPKEFFDYCAANGLFFLWEAKVNQAKKYIKDARLESVPGVRITEKAKTTFRGQR
jgi:hypothetical protein